MRFTSLFNTAIREKFAGKGFGFRFCIALVLVVTLTGQFGPTAAAISPEQRKLFQQGIYYYNIDEGCQAAASASDSSTAPTIVIDPGHSGSDIHDNDPQTGLYDHDYPNYPELAEVWGVAQNVKTKLEKDGYNVVMTKNNMNGSVSFRDRADIANKAGADLAVSIHDNHDTSWDNMGGGDGGQVYVQKVGNYRQNKPGMGSGSQKVTFDDSAIADKSQQYGQVFATQRAKAEGHKVSVAPISFDGRSDLPSGNLPMVQLFAKVPWVYNEVGAPNGALPQAQLDKYAQGIIDGVESSVPAGGGAGTSQSAADCTCQAGTSTLTGKDNEEKTWNYFKGKGLSDEQVAGIMGNIEQESSFDPQIMEIGGRSKDPYDAGSKGWGIIQWSGNTGSTGDKVTSLYKDSGLTEPIYLLSTQLDLVWKHMQNNPPITTGAFDINYFKTIGDEVTAAQYFGLNIEGFGIAGGRWDDATDMLRKYQGKSGGGQVTAGGGCASTGTPDCQTAAGTAKILCEAKKYDTVSYEESVRGGHQGGKAWHDSCPTTGPSCVLDCSGLVNIAVFDAFGTDLRENTYSEASDSQYWKRIDFSELQPGDLIQPAAYFPDHVEIVDHIEGNKIYSFGAHSSNHPQPDQVGPAGAPWVKSGGDLYLHYVGPGAK